MGLRVIPYRRGPEIPGLTRGFLRLGDGLRVVVPSRKDRDWWERWTGQDQYLFDHDGAPWTWQDLYDGICADCGLRRRRPISPPDHLLILRRILEGVLDEDTELTRLWPGVARPGFLDALSDDLRELMNEGVRPEQLEIDASGPMPRLLPGVYSRYLAYLEDNGLLDSAQVGTATADLLRGPASGWGEGLTVVLAGFLSFTHGQLDLVRELVARCRDVAVLKPDAGMAGFHDAAGQLGFLQVGPEPSPGRVLEVPVQEPGLEPEALARALALWPAGKGDFAPVLPFPGFASIGIMAGDRDALVRALERYRVPFTLDLGVPISQSLPGRVLAAIRTLQALRFPPYETALLLSQPCFTDGFPMAGALRAGPSGLRGWERYLQSLSDGVPSSALLAVRAIRALCRTLEEGGTPAELMGAFQDFLMAPGLWLECMERGYPELDESLRTTASAIETVKEKALALRELLPDIGPLGRTKLKGEAAFDFLETWCRQTDTRPPLPLAGAVHVHAAQPPVLASYPVWIMMHVTQGTWPGHIVVSPLLGETERGLIAQNRGFLPSLRDKEAQREALFRRLLQTGEVLTVLTCPERDEEGRLMKKSPLLPRFLEELKGEGWTGTELPVLPISILTGEGCLFPEVDPAPDPPAARGCPHIHDAEVPPIVGVSSLHELLSCPMLWWVRRRAQLREHSLEIAPSTRWGSLVHALWERVWRRFQGDLEVPFAPLVEEEWGRLLADQEGEFGGLTGDPRLQRQLEFLRFRVLRLGALQGRVIERLRQTGFSHREIALEEDARLKITLEGVTFTGQCDRVEVLEGPGGLLALITDYKNGRSKRYDARMVLGHCAWNRTDRGGDGREAFHFGLQLSAYALMFTRQRPEVPLAGVGFLGLEDGKIDGTFSQEVLNIFQPEASRAKRMSQSLKDRMEEAEYAMRRGATWLRAGDFAPDYDCDFCRVCSLKSLCRRGELRGEQTLEDRAGAEEDG